MTRFTRRTFLRSTGAAATAGLAGCTSHFLGSSSPQTYHNPVFGPVFPDPSVIRTDDGTYYAYSTQANWKNGNYAYTTHAAGQNAPMDNVHVIPIIRSQDLVNWTHIGDVFNSLPDWHGGNVWAPDINHYNGHYYVYYADSKWGSHNAAIGVATAPHPEGPWTDHGKLFTSEEIGVHNSIDPAFYDDGGTPYLVWGSFHGIYGIELTPDGLGYGSPSDKFQIAGANREASYIIKRNGYYYYFASAGSCCSGADSTYHVTVGRSKSFEGPYVNSMGDRIMDFPGTVVVRSDDQFAGPGHNAVATDNAGNDWLVYHAYVRDDPYFGSSELKRQLFIDRLVWKNGWPRVKGKTPSTSAPAPKT